MGPTMLKGSPHDAHADHGEATGHPDLVKASPAPALRALLLRNIALYLRQEYRVGSDRVPGLILQSYIGLTGIRYSLERSL